LAVGIDRSAEERSDARILVLGAGGVVEVEAKGRGVKEGRPEDLINERVQRRIVDTVSAELIEVKDPVGDGFDSRARERRGEKSRNRADFRATESGELKVARAWERVVRVACDFLGSPGVEGEDTWGRRGELGDIA